MAEQSRGATRYITIAEKIERELARPDESVRLASERDLTERFDCQRGTVRRALQLLESRGLIYRRGRSGWYRTPARLDYVLTGAPPLAELTAQLGRELTTEVLTTTAPRRHISPDGMVFVARRRRSLDGWPIVVEDIHLLSDLRDRIEPSDLRDSTTSILASVGVNVSFEQAALEADAAPDWVGAILGIRVGGALLKITRQRFVDLDLVQCDTEWWRADAVRLHVAVTGDAVRTASPT